jgi:hypothetical protein
MWITDLLCEFSMRFSLADPKVLSILVFVIFLAVRISGSLIHLSSFTVYPDAYNSYVPAGVAYVSGALPDSVNAEHPPLAKYIIGFFAVYLGSPELASLLFGFFCAVIVLYLTRALIGRVRWALASVCILAFDQVNVSISIYPMLEIFMLLFALLTTYFANRAKTKWGYAIAVVFSGFAIACKWTAVFIILPVILFIIIDRGGWRSLLYFGGTVIAYLVSYADLIAAKGFSSFLQLQAWMFQFMLNMHGIGAVSVITFVNRALPFLYLSNYNPLNPLAITPPGALYISMVQGMNAIIASLIFPSYLLEIKKYLSDKSGVRLALILVASSLLLWQMLFFDPVESWFYAPIMAITGIFIADLLNDCRDNGRCRMLSYLYLMTVALWPLVISLHM